MSDDCVIVEDRCYFCDNNETVLFNEHFFFCPRCTAIYVPITVHSGCEHVAKFAPMLYRYPWKDHETDKPFVYMVMLDGQWLRMCSECEAVIASDTSKQE